MRNVKKAFGASVALEDFTIGIESGELVCLLGPSGCGKTTALRILAGFEKADAGEMSVDAQDITQVAVERRNFSMVFQDYSLFPNMTARQNIEFALKSHKVAGGERAAIIDRMLSVTSLEDQANKFPHQMSGGQKQRVALARAMATSPRVLLLDEPLSALDAKVRESLREEIRRLQREIGVTTVFVTHDQHEALAIADRVGVMSNGRLEQIATPRDLYETPANPFVATFVGSINKVPAVGGPNGSWQCWGSQLTGTRRSSLDERALIGVRPEEVQVRIDPSGTALITDVSFLGPITRINLALDEGSTVVADLMSAECGQFAPDLRVGLSLRTDVHRVVVF
jgi:putative spermidine/putrescine transport system ATP-binding protein